MSDTKALIKYVRDRLNDGPNITFGKPTVLDLVEALESAEANAKDNSEALTAAYMSGKYDVRKEADANVARLTKERDWLAELVFDRPCAYACCPFDKHRPTGPDDDDCDKTHIQCWAEAARRAVAESEVNG